MASRRAIDAGKANILLSLSDKLLGKQLRKLSRRLSSIGSMFTRLGQVASAAGASVVSAFALAARTFAKSGDAIEKMSVRTGVSAKSLSQLKFAAEQSGTSIDSLGAALFRSRRRIANATTATGPAARALKELGIEANKLNDMSPEDQFFALADALAGMDDQNRAAQMGFELFGDNFREIVPLLANGSEGIRDLMGEAEQLGLTLSDEDATAAAKLTDAFHVLTSQFKGFVIQVGAAVADDLIQLFHRMRVIGMSVISWTKDNRQLIATIAKTAVVVSAIGASLLATGLAFTVASVAVGGFMSVIAALAAVVSFLLSPLTLVVAGIAALSAWVVKSSGLLGSLAHNFDDLKTVALSMIGGIASALVSGDIDKAADIFWKGLKRLWTSGSNSLASIWENLWFDMLNIWHEIQRKMSQGVLNVLSAILKPFELLLESIGTENNEALVSIREFRKAIGEGPTGILPDVFDEKFKENERNRAARLKQLEEERKAAQELFDGLELPKIDSLGDLFSSVTDRLNIDIPAVMIPDLEMPDLIPDFAMPAAPSRLDPVSLFDASRAAQIFGRSGKSGEKEELEKANEKLDRIAEECRKSNKPIPKI